MQTTAEHAVDRQPQKFNEGQPVTLLDLRPNATTKWRQATIITQIGPLIYEVDQTRTAHVDHIRPALMGDHLPSDPEPVSSQATVPVEPPLDSP